MSRTYGITHFYHSGFTVTNDDTMLVFDYWRGEEGELTGRLALSDEQVAAFAHVYVFISHEHIDHLDPIVFTWKNLTDVSYIVSSDMPVGTRGKRMAPGDTLTLAEDITVTAFDSTDLGVSFLVHFRELSVFHAGDLNFWHWREESTMQEIEEADAEFRKAVAPISRELIDVAFFPLDPRQGSMFESGANYFLMAVKPRIMVPMHYFHRTDVAMDYARTASNRATEVIAMPGFRETMLITVDDDGYLNLQPGPEEPVPGAEAASDAGSPENPGSSAEDPAELSEDGSLINDPFSETDLPVSMLSDPPEEGTDKPANPAPASDSP